mmetsp:Transcript_32239/g.79126  ORF Transcript_32239/g.79126 Transcript_32239/m.79126 type:complete len:267 (-) Transcript_32239:740-1540(-)
MSASTAVSSSFSLSGSSTLGGAARRASASTRSAPTQVSAALQSAAEAAGGFCPTGAVTPAAFASASALLVAEGGGSSPPAHRRMSTTAKSRPSTASAMRTDESLPTGAERALALAGRRSTEVMARDMAPRKVAASLARSDPSRHSFSASALRGNARSERGTSWASAVARQKTAASSCWLLPAPAVRAFLRAATTSSSRESRPAEGSMVTLEGAFSVAERSEAFFSSSFLTPSTKRTRALGSCGGCMLLEVILEPSTSSSARVTTCM